MNSCYFVLFGLPIWLSEERLAAFAGTSLLPSIAHATQSDAELWFRQDMDNDAYRFYSGLICLLMRAVAFQARSCPIGYILPCLCWFDCRSGYLRGGAGCLCSYFIDAVYIF